MKTARYILLSVLTALLLWGVLWAHDKAGDEVCRRVEIQIVNQDSISFVNQRGIVEDLKNAHIKLEGLPMWHINSDKIENLLAQSQYLESADCVKGINGVFIIRVKQLVPVMRIFDGNESYYVNRNGKRMNASANYFSDVPVVKGHFTAAYSPVKLLPMIDYVEHDPVLSSLVTMYDFKGPQDVFIVPCFQGHVVNMGDIENFESKFQKLLLFYRNVMPVKGWETYDTISLKWNHQVVASRRGMQVQETMEYDPEDDEIAPDLETMTTTADNRPDATVTKNSKSKESKQNPPEHDKEKKDANKKHVDEPKKEVKTSSENEKKRQSNNVDSKKPKKTDSKTADSKKDNKKAKTSDNKKKEESKPKASKKKDKQQAKKKK